MMRAGQYLLVHAALTFAAYERNQRKAVELHHEHFSETVAKILEKFINRADIQDAQIRHLCHVIEQHGVEVTDFDLIVLNFQNQASHD